MDLGIKTYDQTGAKTRDKMVAALREIEDRTRNCCDIDSTRNIPLDALRMANALITWGEGEAIANTDTRESLIRSLTLAEAEAIDTQETLEHICNMARSALAQEPDPIIDLVKQWRVVWDMLQEADPDAPESKHLTEQMDSLDTLICGTVAQTPAGLKAQLEYMRDSFSDLWGGVGDGLDYKVLDALIAGARGMS